MDRHIEIGRGIANELTKGIIKECDVCGKGSMVVERRRGHVIHSICTNLSCDSHPNILTAKRIEDILTMWVREGEIVHWADELTPDQIKDIAEFLFKNLL